MISPDLTELMTQPDHETPDLAQTAFVYFVQASLACPASVTGQAAKVLHLAREAEIIDLNPLKTALLDSEAHLLAIQRAAQAQHTSDRSPKVVPIVTNEGQTGIVDIVESVFEYTNYLRLLTDEQLENLYTVYYQRYASNPRKVGFDFLWAKAEGMLRGG